MRLGVIWEAVEVQPGVYNDTYLDEIEKLINKLGKAGIFSMVDGHQDLLSRAACGEGMPNFYAQRILNSQPVYAFGEWADWLLCKPLQMFLMPEVCENIQQTMKTDSEGNPLWSECAKVPDFGNLYGSATVQSLFRGLFANTAGTLDAFAAYWYHVAHRFSENQYVVGYNPLNEPAGSGLGILDFLMKVAIQGKMDQDLLGPMYSKLQ